MADLGDDLAGTRWRGASGDVATVERVEAGFVIGKWDSGVLWSEHKEWLLKLYTRAPSEPENKAGPHKFQPLRLWDLRPNGRCRHCLIPMNAHPVHGWIQARAMGDKRKAELSWESLSGGSRA